MGVLEMVLGRLFFFFFPFSKKLSRLKLINSSSNQRFRNSSVFELWMVPLVRFQRAEVFSFFLLQQEEKKRKKGGMSRPLVSR
jgi:hypothetical protein